MNPRNSRKEGVFPAATQLSFEKSGQLPKTEGKPNNPVNIGKHQTSRWCYRAILVAALAFALALYFGRIPRWRGQPATLAELLHLSSDRLSQVPLGRMDLLCASSLEAANEPDLEQCMANIGLWAEHVRSETERHWYRFERDPAQFENSKGFFRMLMLAVVLAEDYGVHYDPRRTAGPATSLTDDGFFSEPRSVFLHGLLGPERIGTCSSLPVLYVAIGRHLGYPLKLATTKGHLLVRWEGEGERFNVEATGHGLNRFDDEYYRHWPFEISAAEEAAEGYLKSLMPAEELAVLLSVRGMCLREAGRLPEATESFEAAVRLAPGCQGYQRMLSSLQVALGRQPMGSASLSKPKAKRTLELHL